MSIMSKKLRKNKCVYKFIPIWQLEAATEEENVEEE